MPNIYKLILNLGVGVCGGLTVWTLSLGELEWFAAAWLLLGVFFACLSAEDWE